MSEINTSSRTQCVTGTSNSKNAHCVDRRQFLRTTGAGAGAFLVNSMLPGIEAAAAPRRPNIVLVVVDQFRQDMSKFIPTPAADRLAREGITFRNALSTTPLCTPFRGMLMTGRYATHSGVLLNFVNVSPLQNPDCVANVFGRAGYKTACIGKWHLSAGIQVADGPFASHPKLEKPYLVDHPEPEFTPPGPGRLGFEFWQAYNFHADFNNYWYYENEPQKIYSHKYETDTEIDQAIDYIGKHKDAENPFFLYVAPHPPHPLWAPSSLPAGYIDKVPKVEDLYHSPDMPNDHNPMDPEKLRIYLAMAMNFDDNLGRLMDYLDKSGAGENTILIFTSDHGEMAGSHGRLNKMVPYAEAVNIPLKMRWPGKIPAGGVSDTLYTPIDHLPTLCGLAGLSTPSMIDGEDLSAAVLGHSISTRNSVLMANYTSHWNYFQTETTWPEWRGVHSGRHTYVKWLTGEEQLFDNVNDPYQMRDLAGDSTSRGTLDDMRHRLKELMITAHDDFLSGREYASWYDSERNLVRTALGRVPCAM